jgi:hypothetical protein
MKRYELSPVERRVKPTIYLTELGSGLELSVQDGCSFMILLVVVAVHETIGIAEPVEPFYCLVHDGQEGLPILVVFKKRQRYLWR